MLAGIKWRKVSWRRGVNGPLSARFVAQRIRVADGPPQRILDKGQQHIASHGYFSPDDIYLQTAATKRCLR